MPLLLLLLFLKDLKKKQAVLKISVIKPNGSSTDVELEGVVEELRRDKKTYQKTAWLHLRSVSCKVSSSLHVFYKEGT